MLIISFAPRPLRAVRLVAPVHQPLPAHDLELQKLFAGVTTTSLGGAVLGFAPGGVLDSLMTSLEITVPATILVTLVSALRAYSLVFGRWRGRNFIFLAIVGLMVVPLQVAILPVVRGTTTWASGRVGTPTGRYRAWSFSTSLLGCPLASS